MHQVALERLESRNCRPAPSVQDARGIDEKVALLFKHLSIGPSDTHGPFEDTLVPTRADYLVLDAYILVQAVLLHKVIEVGVYLAR